MEPSKYQQAILDWLREGKGNGTCNAVAGSGKSTTLKLAALSLKQQGISPNQIKIIVFGKQNSLDLIAKFGKEWKNSIQTSHSLGFDILKQEIGKFSRHETIKKQKYQLIAQDMGFIGKKYSKKPGKLEQKAIESRDSFFNLINLVRLTLSDISPDGLKKLIIHYNLEGICDLSKVSQAIADILLRGQEQALDHIIDYTDMIWLPVQWELNTKSWFTTYQYVLIDECQDLNAAQLELSLMLPHQTGRLLYVGDPRQAIFGFAGADNQSYYNIVKRTQATELPLSICYRCPKSHINLVKQIFPDIPIESAPNAAFGTLESIQKTDLWAEDSKNRLKIGDMVLSRKTAPLVSLCIRLIAKNIAATVRGKDIGKQIKDDLQAIALIDGFTYKAFNQFVDVYKSFKFQTYLGRDNEEQLKENLIDKLDALKTIYSSHPNVQSVEQLCQCIDDLFSDEESPVTLSTCHRAKGLENERIFIIKPNDLPMTWKNQLPWQEKQEDNLLYVALTRSKSDLFIVGNPDWLKDTSKPTKPAVIQADDTTPSSTENSLQFNSLKDLETEIAKRNFQDQCQLLEFLEKLVTQQKWDRVRSALEKDRNRSDRAIALTTNTSAPFVGKVRQTLIKENFLLLENQRVDQRGRKHKAQKPKF